MVVLWSPNTSLQSYFAWPELLFSSVIHVELTNPCRPRGPRPGCLGIRQFPDLKYFVLFCFLFSCSDVIHFQTPIIYPTRRLMCWILIYKTNKKTVFAPIFVWVKTVSDDKRYINVLPVGLKRKKKKKKEWNDVKLRGCNFVKKKIVHIICFFFFKVTCVCIPLSHLKFVAESYAILNVVIKSNRIIKGVDKYQFMG